jgi:hypothetical protein
MDLPVLGRLRILLHRFGVTQFGFPKYLPWPASSGFGRGQKLYH